MAKRRNKNMSSIKQIQYTILFILFVLIISFLSSHPIIIVVIIAAVLGFYIFKFVRKLNRIKQLKLNAEIMRQRILSSGIKEIDVMEGEEFERFLGTLFEQLGCIVQYTPKSNDYGADLILTNTLGRKLVIQAKRYGKNVGLEAVQQAKAAEYHYNASQSIVITNRDFSDNARELARTTKVVLMNREGLIELIHKGKGAEVSFL
jgi:restriction system protein